MRKKNVLFILVAIVVLMALAVIMWFIASNKAPTVARTNMIHSTTKAVSNQRVVGFDKTKYSLTDPTSMWVVVNKQHPLQPMSYAPSDLTVPSVPLSQPGQSNMQMRAMTAQALGQLFAAAKSADISLEVVSAYRSYAYQQSVYGGYVSSVGQASADQESARPGYSEHQTGLAVDIGGTDNVCVLSQCFGTTPEGEWLAANAYKYGFLLRYPQGKEAITGYEYEPWHFRYIGAYLSEEMHNDNIQTLEEFFDVNGGTAY